VLVRGVQYRLGDGVKTKDCYFSGDAGVTARAIMSIVPGDELFWNALISAVPLDPTDVIDLNYSVAGGGGLQLKQCSIVQATPNRVLINFKPGSMPTGFVVVVG